MRPQIEVGGVAIPGLRTITSLAYESGGCDRRELS